MAQGAKGGARGEGWRLGRGVAPGARVGAWFPDGRGQHAPSHTPLFLSRAGIKGIGRYTAGAVASICGGVAAPIVDGNVLRVASRLHAVAASAKEPAYCADGKLSWSIARQLVEAGGGERPGELNQATTQL